MSKKRFDKEALILLNKAYKDRKGLQGENLRTAQLFLESAIGNRELNTFLKHDELNTQDMFPALKNYLTYFSYKTRDIDIDKVSKSLEKMTRAQADSKDGLSVAEEDKVTLKEFAIISDISKTTKFLAALDSGGFIKGNKNLEQLYETAKKAEEIIGNLNQEIGRDLTTVGPGAIVFEDTNKSASLKRVALTFFEKVKKLFTKYEHTSSLHVENNKAVTSEITHAYDPKNFDVDIVHHLKSDTYKINVSTLIPKENHKLMQEAYGDDWKAQLATKYKLIENDIHGERAQQRFGDLRAASGGGIKQLVAGFANLIPFGHKQIKPNDFEEIHRKVMSNHYASETNPTMLCSEFSGRTTIAALIELDKQVKKDISEKNLAEGLDLQKNIVQIPFGKHEDLHKLHPARLLKVLQEYGCVEKVTVKTDNYFKEATNVGNKVKKHISKAPIDNSNLKFIEQVGNNRKDAGRNL